MRETDGLSLPYKKCTKFYMNLFLFQFYFSFLSILLVFINFSHLLLTYIFVKGRSFWSSQFHPELCAALSLSMWVSSRFFSNHKNMQLGVPSTVNSPKV